jgi:tetratricopeptide (TPR) repeat protein
VPALLKRSAEFCEIGILSLLSLAVLWKGGKTLESTWLLVGVGCICTLLFRRHKTQEAGHKHDLLWLFVILLIVWTGLSYAFSSTLNYGLDEVLRTGGLGLIFLWYIGRKTQDTGHRTQEAFENRFFTLITFLVTISCLTGLAVYIFQPVNRFVGTFFDWRFHTDYWPNASAQFLLITWPITLLKDWSIDLKKFHFKKRKYDKAFHAFRPLLRYIPTGLALGCLLLTFSRGAIIAFIGQVALLTILIFKRQGTVKNMQLPLRRMATALLIGLLIFISINELRSVIHPVQTVIEKVTFQASEGKSSISERADFWNQALNLTMEKPLFGWGPYSFRFVQPRLQNEVLATSDHPHNVFLKLSMERGIIALIAFAAILFFVIRSGIKLTLSGKRLNASTDHARLGYALLTVAIAGAIAHNLIDYNLQFIGIALPFWIVMAILVCHAGNNQNDKFKISHRYKSLVTNLVAIILLVIAFGEGMFLVTSSRGRHAEARGDYKEALNWYEESEGEWFTRDLNLSQTHLYLNSENIESAKKSLSSYFKKNSEDARAWKLQGDINMIEAENIKSIESYEKAFEYGGWNDLSISSGLLESLLAETYTQPTSDAAADSQRLPLNPRIPEVAPLIEKRVKAFAGAIAKNLHFIALSPNPEEAIKILITLSVIYPEKSEEYKILIDDIDTHTKEERGRIKSRMPGWLW